MAYLERIESELRSARELQMAMVPTLFPSPTAANPVEIFATLEPARQVGGDLYDFFYSDQGKFCFLVWSGARTLLPEGNHTTSRLSLQPQIVNSQSPTQPRRCFPLVHLHPALPRGCLGGL